MEVGKLYFVAERPTCFCNVNQCGEMFERKSFQTVIFSLLMFFHDYMKQTHQDEEKTCYNFNFLWRDLQGKRTVCVLCSLRLSALHRPGSYGDGHR